MIHKLVDKCDENINEEVEILDRNKDKFNSCLLHIVLFSMFFTINIGAGAYFAYYKYVNGNKNY